MVMSSPVWTWCIVIVRVSPSATAFWSAFEPNRTKQSARPHDVAARTACRRKTVRRAAPSGTGDLALTRTTRRAPRNAAGYADADFTLGKGSTLTDPDTPSPDANRGSDAVWQNLARFRRGPGRSTPGCRRDPAPVWLMGS